MSFEAKIEFLSIPRSADVFHVKDDTGNYPDDPTGYGVTGGPANQAAITALFAQITPYGESEQDIEEVEGVATLDDDVECTVNVKDGVNTLGLLFGESIEFEITAISTDRKTLTVTGGEVEKLDGVYALQIDGTTFPCRIRSASGTTVILWTALPGTEDTYTEAFRYYLAESKQLVLIHADGKISKETAAIPISIRDCDKTNDIFHLLELKVSAETAFANEDDAKAHQAARLITESTTISNSSCSIC